MTDGDVPTQGEVFRGSVVDGGLTADQSHSAAIIVSAQPDHNAAVLQRVLAAQDYGLPCISAPAVEAVAEAIRQEAALVVISEEVLATDEGIQHLITSLNQQPEWSDIPVILLLRDCRRFPGCRSLAYSMNYAGSLVLLERPLKRHVFYSVVQACLANRQRQYALRDLLQQLRESNQTLESFSHTAAHELKHPLGVITTSLDLLSSNPPEPKRQKLLDMGRRTARNMTRTLEALLAYGKLKAAKDIEIAPVDMMTVLEQAQFGLQQLIAERNAKVHWSGLPKVHGNEQLLVQLVSNLIKNAIVHNPMETPEVSISIQPQSGYWRFYVADNGPGIAPENQHRVFVLFERGSRTSAGSGLGLALCRRIVALHHGTIGIESQSGQGSRFYFDLPEGK